MIKSVTVRDEIAARETRTADRFAAMRRNGSSQKPEDLIEPILFGTEPFPAVRRLPTMGSCRC